MSSKFRAAIAATLKDAAGINATTATLEQIAEAVNDMHERGKQTHAQLGRELDRHETAVAERTAELHELCDMLKAQAKLTKESCDALLSESARKLRDVQRDLDITRASLEAQGAVLSDQINAAKSALTVVLQRPIRLLEIFGQEQYQAIKDVYTGIGGDPAAIPMPPPSGREADEQPQE